jgi:hypothetical protein
MVALVMVAKVASFDANVLLGVGVEGNALALCENRQRPLLSLATSGRGRPHGKRGAGRRGPGLLIINQRVWPFINVVNAVEI